MGNRTVGEGDVVKATPGFSQPPTVQKVVAKGFVGRQCASEPVHRVQTRPSIVAGILPSTGFALFVGTCGCSAPNSLVDKIHKG